jgi:hypothetical protein
MIANALRTCMCLIVVSGSEEMETYGEQLLDLLHHLLVEAEDDDVIARPDDDILVGDDDMAASPLEVLAVVEHIFVLVEVAHDGGKDRTRD